MNRAEAQRKAEALVNQMTVEEAAEQLKYDAPAIQRLGVPAYNWWNEALHGVARAGTATMFPQAIGMAAMFHPERVRELGDVAATEGRAKYNAAVRREDRDIYKGLTFWSPNINIFRDPRWGRGQETYGEDPYLTAETGKAYVKGLQGEEETLKSAACAKHFAAHSGPESTRHTMNVEPSPKDMEETYLYAFEELVKDGVEAVMGAYNRLYGFPCCGSKPLIQNLLREKWGFAGHFVSDCWAIEDFHVRHKVTDTPEESAAMALKAGCDINCGVTYRYILKAYRQGLVSESDIRKAAVRAFTTRYLLGVMEGSQFDQIEYSVVECEDHLEKAHLAALESAVLLKNNGTLPLQEKRLKTLAVVGPNANNRRALVGNYFGTSSRYITVLEGLQDALPKTRIYYSEGADLFRDGSDGLCKPDDRIAEAIACAEMADAVVAVVGLDGTLEGEQGDASNTDASGDRKTLMLPNGQKRLLEAMLDTGKPVVIVLMSGSAVDLGEAAEKADAILEVWYPGARGGRAVAELLLGKASPSGKLPVTFYHENQLALLPPFEDYSMQGRTYRYIEGEPLYPFGYGLTYGDVSVRSANAMNAGDHISVAAEVINEGNQDTWDVVQVYCEHTGTPNATLHPALCAFQKVFVPKGETRTVQLSVREKDMCIVTPEGNRVIEGDIILHIGMGQPNAQTESLTGHKSIALKI